MSAFTKVEYELAAPVVLLQSFPDFVKNPVKGEKPDWKDPEHGIGIEVSIAQTKHMGYTTHFFNKYHGMHKSKIPQKELDGFQGMLEFDENDRLVVVSESRGMTDRAEYIVEALKSARKKLERLNASDFDKYDQNALFLFVTGTILKEDSIWFLGEYSEAVRDWNAYYSDVFLMDYDSITHFDFLEQEIHRREFSDREIDDMQELIHLLRHRSNWTDGVRFFDVYRSEMDGLRGAK